MSYSFEVINNEDNMINYFKGEIGLGIKDTLIVNIRNNGSKGWQKYSGYFKCLEEKSNIYFDNSQIPQEVYPNGLLEIVLNFSRIEKNKNSGKCFTTLQLIYKDEIYNDITINFYKDYDLFGKKIVIEEHIEKEDNNKKDYFNQPNIIEKEDNEIIIKKFRSAFQFSKNDFSDDYLKELLKQAKNNFQTAMMIHIENEDKKKELNKQKVKNENEIYSLIDEFRNVYQLSKDDYPDDVIKKALQKKEGNFENTFEELMSFIE